MATKESKHNPRAPELTSKIMARVRAKNNKAEVVLRKLLWSQGQRYRLYVRSLPGTPDIVFTKHAVAVFVDGDFWHGRIFADGGEDALRTSLRTDRREFWIEKIKRNYERDRRTDEALHSLGWKVVRLWERDILRNPQAAAESVTSVLHRNRSPGPSTVLDLL